MNSHALNLTPHLRAKLTTLDTKNIDLEFQNSILLERVSAFEKAEKDAIYEKYFPKPVTFPSSVGASPPSQPDPHSHTHCCCLRVQYCQPSHSCHQTSQEPVPLQTGITDVILKSISELKSDLSTLKSNLSSKFSVNQPMSATEQNSPKPSTSYGNMATDLNDSIVTVDENIPELSDEEELNSKVPTI